MFPNFPIDTKRTFQNLCSNNIELDSEYKISDYETSKILSQSRFSRSYTEVVDLYTNKEVGLLVKEAMLELCNKYGEYEIFFKIKKCVPIPSGIKTFSNIKFYCTFNNDKHQLWVDIRLYE